MVVDFLGAVGVLAHLAHACLDRTLPLAGFVVIGSDVGVFERTLVGHVGDAFVVHPGGLLHDGQRVAPAVVGEVIGHRGVSVYPSIEDLLQFMGLGRVLVGEVMLIADIGFKIVEFGAIRPGDDLVPAANEHARVEIVVRVIEVPDVAVVGVVFDHDLVARIESRGIAEVEACHRGGRFDAGDMQYGGGGVDHAGESGGIASRLDLTWLADHDGGADAGLVRLLFGTHVAVHAFGIGNPAVVAHVDNDGVVGDAALVEGIEHLAAGFVEPFDVGPVAGGGFIGSDVTIFLIQLLPGIVRRMGQEDAIPDKERLVGRDGFIDEVVVGLLGFAADLEADVAVATAARGIAVGHGVGEAVLLGIFLPPLAGLQGQVTVVAQEFDHGRLVVQRGGHFRPPGRELIGDVMAAFTAGEHGVVAADAVLERVHPRGHAGERRSA